MSNNRLATESQDIEAKIELTQSQNEDIGRRSDTIVQEEDIEIRATISQNIDAEVIATVPQNNDEIYSINNKTDEIVLSNKMFYTSDNGRLNLELKKEDRMNIKSGEAILFKNKVPTQDGKEVEAVVKVFKNINIHSDAKKLENRRNILKLLYEKRKEVEENNLARVISYGKVRIGEKEYFAEVYRYYSGGDLKNKDLKYEEIEKKIIPSLLKALRYLHSHNIVHRDIKPENIYVDAKERIYLGDFGIARYIESNIDYDDKKFGTLGYSAPELLDSRKGMVTKETDYYSLGQTLYSLFTKELMYKFIIDMKISNDEKIDRLIEEMRYDKYYGFAKFKDHRSFEALIRGLLKNSLADRFNDTHIERFLKENSLSIDTTNEVRFSKPLKMFDTEFYSKKDMYNFLIKNQNKDKNKDKARKVLENEYFSKYFDDIRMPIDRDEVQKIEKEFKDGDEFEKKYQLFKLYKFLKDEYIFIWDNREIKDYKDIISISAEDIKKLLLKKTIQNFLRKLKFDEDHITAIEKIKLYKEDLIIPILNIYFDSDNNGKDKKEYTYHGENLNELISKWINDTSYETSIPLEALLSIIIEKQIDKSDQSDFYIELDANTQEDETKVRIREKFLHSYINDNTLITENYSKQSVINITESYQKLEELIFSIKNKYYEATGPNSKEILDNISDCEISIERMNINEIREKIKKFTCEYKKFKDKFENTPYFMIKKHYQEDLIITRYCKNYPIQGIGEYYEKLKTIPKKENIVSLFIVSIISFLSAYVLNRKDLYLKYIIIDNTIIKILIPQFKYLFYAIGTYFVVKTIICMILKLSINYKHIEKKYTDIFNKTFGNKKVVDSIHNDNGILKRENLKFIEDCLQVIPELNKLEEKYISTIDIYDKIRKIQLFLPVLSMILVLFFVFKNVNIFSNEYFLFKLYGYFLYLAIIYTLAIEKYTKTLFYSKNIILALSTISVVGLSIYKYTIENSTMYGLSIQETSNIFKPALIGLVLLILMMNNIRNIIENVNSYLLYILLIPGILIPLSFLTEPNTSLKWYHFYLLIAMPGVIGAVLNKTDRILGYLMYKIPFALLGYSLIIMSGTPMFRLSGFFNGFVMLFIGDIFVLIVLGFIVGAIGAIV